MTNEHHYDFFVTQRDGKRVLVVKYNLELIQQTAAEIPLAPGAVELRITGTKEIYHLSFSQNGEPFREISRVNTRYLGTEVTSGYNGVVIGLYATGNKHKSAAPADFDWFEYEPLSQRTFLKPDKYEIRKTAPPPSGSRIPVHSQHRRSGCFLVPRQRGAGEYRDVLRRRLGGRPKDFLGPYGRRGAQSSGSSREAFCIR
jgi:hypothetical protein